MAGDPVLQISASTTITIPKISSTTPSARCSTGSLSLEATATNGIVNWYTTSTGNTTVTTGNTYTTPTLTATTTYYVDAITGHCPTVPRTEIIATIRPLPSITTTNPNSRCQEGTVSLSATSSAGTVNWYDAAAAGIAIGNGSSFTTPSISSSTTFYVDATANGCTTASRTPIIATVFTPPTITTTLPNSRRDAGMLYLAATASGGIINWHTDETTGTPIGTGPSFTTPNIETTTLFYVDATENNCTSPIRKSVSATVIPITITTEEVVLCQGKTSLLDASISGMKYLWSPGGETTQTIVVSATGNYVVTINPPDITSCESKKND